jgi:hypothetical protein
MKLPQFKRRRRGTCHRVAVDAGGSVYLAEGDLDRVLKETPSADCHIQSTVAKRPANGIEFSPGAVAEDGSGNASICDAFDN